MSSSAITDLCRVCGSSEGKHFDAFGYGWRRCFMCHGIQKQITKEQYWAMNPTYDPGSYLDSKDREEIESYREGPSQSRTLSRVSQRHLGILELKREFLDVGCGMGAYMLAAQHLGFDVTGFEPSVDHAHIAKDVLKLPVINDYFSIKALDGKQFDLIMLSHVIEHIYNPSDLMEMLVAALKPGGVLVVVTPNSNSLIAILTGRYWVMLRPVDHVSMISADAYRHFHLPFPMDVHHSWSEYSFEFAATILASAKAWIAGRRDTKHSTAPPHSKLEAPPVLKRPNVWTKILKTALSMLSFPAYVIATLTCRRACLISVLVRRN